MAYNPIVNRVKNNIEKKHYIEHCDLELECHEKYRSDNKDKINEYFKNRKKSDSNYKLNCNLRSRTSTAFKSPNVRKTNKTFDLLGFSHSFFKEWIIHQLYGNMTIENYGSVWQLDHCLPIASFNILYEIDMKKCFDWVNLRPMPSNEIIPKKAKFYLSFIFAQADQSKFFHEVKCLRRIILKLF